MASRKVRVRICIGTNCSFHGGQLIYDKLDSEPLLQDHIDLETVKCFDKACKEGKNSPVVEIDGKLHARASIEKISEIIFTKLKKAGEL
nr:NAD(P)H-dependent oxidoreductase subunit E [Candidatus Sigynarchaeota archaeon]